MELSFEQLRTKDVINICDGSRMGRFCDIIFTFPENKVKGFTIPTGFFKLAKNDIFVDVKSIKKIGSDVILVELKDKCPKRGDPCKDEDEKKPKEPQHWCMPGGRGGNCNTGERRSYDEYE